MVEPVEVVVVGAGPGGLGTAGLLTRAGVSTVVLERGQVGDKWRRAYDRLRINTSTLTSHLPGVRFPARVGLWPARDDLVEYYDRYVQRLGIDVRSPVEVCGVDRDARGWRVRTGAGDLLARAVVIATGRDSIPVVPEWPGRERFQGQLLHAAAYRNAGAYRDADVLVVGVGNSGADIAVDLLDGGARSVRVAVRTPPHLVRRTVAGIPNDLLQVLTGPLPARLVDAAGERIRRSTYGDLEAKGLGRPPIGVKTYVETQARVPTIDAGPFSRAVRGGRIEVTAGVVALDDGGVRLADGERIAVDVIVAATGYRPGLDPLIGHLGVLDRRGWPRWAPATHGEDRSLLTVGFGDPTRGNLRGLRLDAGVVSRAIVADLRRRGDRRRSEGAAP